MESATVIPTPANPSDRIRNRPAFVVLTLAMGLAGCVTEVTPPTQTIWETTLIGLAHPDVAGSAASISSGGTTQASILVSGLPAGMYSWGVFEGTCAEPAGILDSAEVYPLLTPGTDGTATAEASVRRSMRSSSAYFAQVLTGAGTRVACGDFVLWQ